MVAGGATLRDRRVVGDDGAQCWGPEYVCHFRHLSQANSINSMGREPSVLCEVGQSGNLLSQVFQGYRC